METIFAPTSERSSIQRPHLLLQREDFALTALALAVCARNTQDIPTRLDLKEEAKLLGNKARSDDPLIEALPHYVEPQRVQHVVEGLKLLKRRHTTPDPKIRGLARQAHRQIIRTAAASAPSPYA